MRTFRLDDFRQTNSETFGADSRRSRRVAKRTTPKCDGDRPCSAGFDKRNVWGNAGTERLRWDAIRKTERMTIRGSRCAAIAVTAAFTLAACGGGEASDSGADAASDLPAVQVADEVAVAPSADIATNQLPDLVVDNLNDDNKVNLRSYGAGDKPILLWMWAPH